MQKIKDIPKALPAIAEWDNLLCVFDNSACDKRLKPDVLLYEKIFENLKKLIRVL